MGLPVKPAGRRDAPEDASRKDAATAHEEAQKQARMQRMGESFKLRIQIAETLKNVKHKFIVMSGKGGVGKSTVAVNLAAALAKQGKKVGLLDVDLTNPNVPHMLGVSDYKPKPSPDGKAAPASVSENLKVMSTEFFLRGRDQPIIWRGPIKMNMIQQLLGNVSWGELDYLVVDLPPGTGDEPLTIAQLFKDADGVVVVTTPQGVAVGDVKKSLEFAKTMDLNVLGVVENMGTFACPHCGESTDIFGKGGGDLLSEQYGVPVLGRIPLEPAVMQAGESGVPFVWDAPKSATADAFVATMDAITSRVEADKDEAT